MFSDYSSDATPRIPVVVASLIVVFTIWAAREIFNPNERFLLVCGMLLSPCLIFYSRFAREDWFVILGLSLMVLGLAKRSILLSACGLALQVATKANFYIHGLLAVAFLFYAWMRGAWKMSIDFTQLRDRRTLMGICVGLLVFIYLSTTEFRNWVAVYEVFSKSLSHWWEMHKIERIAGPFSFHLTVMALYEQPLFLLILATCLHFILTSSLKRYEKAIVISSLIFLPFFFNQTLGGKINYEVIKDTRVGGFLVDVLKLKGPIDLISALYILGFGFCFTERYIKEDFKLSALSFAFFSVLFTYSYAGEKVPWLAIYPIVAGYLFLASYWSKQQLKDLLILVLAVLLSFYLTLYIAEITSAISWTTAESLIYGVVWNLITYTILFLFGLCLVFGTERVKFEPKFDLIVALGLVLYCLLILRVNFSLRVREITLLSQVHTNFQLKDLAHKLTQASYNNPMGRPLKVGYSGDATWPLAWYFKDNPNFIFFIEHEDIPNLNLDCVFVDEGKDIEKYGYNGVKVPIRSWILYDLNRSSFREFLGFLMFGDGDPGYGSSYTKFGCKPGIVF